MMINETRCATSGGHVAATRGHVFTGKDNEEIHVLQGSAAELDDMVADAKIGGSMYAIRHFTISPEVEMTRDEMQWTLDQLGQTYNFDPADAVIVEHQKPRAGGAGYDRHWHVLAPEYDIEVGRIMKSSKSHQIDERIARDTERRFGHPMVVGANQITVADWIEKRGNEGDKDFAQQLRQAYEDRGQPRSSFTKDAFQAAKRRGLSLTECRAEIKELWTQADGGKAFKNALESNGYALDRGEKKGVWLVQKDGQIVGALDRLVKEMRADVAERLDGVQPTSQQIATLPISGVNGQPVSKEARQPESTEARSSGPSLGRGAGGGGGASTDAPEAMTDIFDSRDEMAAVKALKKASDAMKKQLRAAAASKTGGGGQEAVIAAQRLAASFRRAITTYIREGERHEQRLERRVLYEANRLAAAGRYADAIEQFEQTWQALAENLVDERPVGDQSRNDRQTHGHDSDAGPAGPAPDRLRGDGGRAGGQQSSPSLVASGAPGGTKREREDPRALGECPDRAGRDLGAPVFDRVEDARRELELGRPDASERLQRLVVQAGVIARQQQNPQEQPETAHQRLKREFAAYRDQHKQREKERWSGAFSRQREIAGVARSLLQLGDGRLAPAAARQLRAATMASNTRLRDVLRQTKPPLDTYAAFVSWKAEIGDPAAQQVHKYIVRREEQKQALLSEVDLVRDDRLAILSSDPWPDAKSRDARLLADDARRKLERPRSRVLEKVAFLDAAAERAEALIGPTDRLAKSLGIITDRLRDAEAARRQADAARAKLEPAETYYFRLKAAKATAEHTAQQRKAEHDKWRTKDVVTAERDLEIAHRIDAAIQSNDRQICRCRTYDDAVRIIEERMRLEREERRRRQIEQQRELERQREQNEPEAGPSLGPRMP